MKTSELGHQMELERFRREAGVETAPKREPLPVHEEIARALEEVMVGRNGSDSWQDLADRLVIALAAHVVFAPKEDYDRMVGKIRGVMIGARE